MIVVDTSAVIAVVTDEPDAARFRWILAVSSVSELSAASLLEATIVASRRGDVVATRRLDRFLTDFDIGVVAVDREQVEIARAALLTFGKGRHAAALNMGDCFAYALAKVRGASLLFKSDGFSKTDVAVAA